MGLDFKKNSKMVTKVMKNSSEDMNNKKRDIDISLIDLNPDNEAIFGHDDIDYMAETIGEDGFSGAIEVYALDNGRYEISSGHRRFLASQQLGHKTIPAIVSENVDDKTKSKKLIKSNILNRKMTALKLAKAMAYYRERVLYDFKGEKTKELARVFNISHTGVKRYLQLLNLAPELQKYADDENVPYTNLISLTKLDSEDQMKVYAALKEIYNNDDNVFLSASNIVVEQNVAKVMGTPFPSKPEKPTSEQAKKRFSEVMDEEKNAEEAPVVPDIPEASEKTEFKSYEDMAINSAGSAFDDELAKAKVIDMQLTVMLRNINNLLTGEFILSKDVREQAREQLTNILEKLK